MESQREPNDESQSNGMLLMMSKKLETYRRKTFFVEFVVRLC
jgi:hypothetical protein